MKTQLKKLTKENIKIALVSLQEIAERGPPIGLVYLATYLRERSGIKNIKVIDRHFENIEKELKKFSPDLIGVTSMTINYSDVLDFAKNQKIKSQTPLIIGGVHISTLPDSLGSCFNLGVIGEGEETFTEVIDLYLKKQEFKPKDLIKIKGIVFEDKNKIITTPKREPIELDTLPFPDFSFVNKEYFSKQPFPGVKEFVIPAFVITSRGCPYKCKFCSTAKFWGGFRLHSPEYVAKLIKHFIDNYNSDYITVLDDLFTISIERLEKIKIELEKLGLLKKIKGMDCQPRTNLINDKMCKIMKELKIKSVNFGFESGSEKMLRWLKEGSVTVEMNKRAIKLCKKYGFIVFGSLIFGAPGEKIEDIERTIQFIDFAIKNKTDYIWIFIAMPYPSTIFWDVGLEKGIINNNMDWSSLDTTPNKRNINDPLLLDEDVSKEKFKQMFLKANKKLRKMRINQMFIFIKTHPKETLEVFLKNPKYYLTRLVNRFYK